MKKKILLADDVELFLHNHRELIDEDQYEVLLARSGIEALILSSREKPDLILLDMFMPDLNGDEVCQRLRSEPDTRHTPIIIASTVGIPGSREQCLGAGCNAFLYKPLSKKKLDPILRAFLDPGGRKTPRVDTQIPCEISNRGRKTTGEIRNLSSGGAYVSSRSPWYPGGDLKLSFDLSEPKMVMGLRAIARWIKGEHPHGSEGAGVEFVDPDHEAVQELKRWIHDQLSDKEGRDADD